MSNAPVVGGPYPRADDDGIHVTAQLLIPRSELSARASRAGGAGGQHVNTSSTRIELMWNVQTSPSLSDDQRTRILEKLATRIDASGELRIVASARRSQRQNRDLAEQRLGELVAGALKVAKKRRATRPGPAAREARLAEKKHTSHKKEQRRWREE